MKSPYYWLKTFFRIETYQCGYVFANAGLDDVWVGIILLIISLAMLTGQV